MTDFSSAAILAPLNWQDFERNSRVLYECVWGDLNTQMNGRQGQAQCGVDIYGQHGGKGDYIGVQCKGKDQNFGKKVKKTELKAELEKARKFNPPIKEFILITTAPDDVDIQEYARVLELEEKKHSKIESVKVLGWGQLQALIAQHDKAIKVFAPDATPFSDKIAAGISELATQSAATNSMLKTQAVSVDEQTALLRAVAEKLGVVSGQNQPTITTGESQIARSELDRHLNNQIDGLRDLLREGKPATSLRMLTKLRTDVGGGASNQIKFRIITNMGTAEHALKNFSRAADLFIEAAEFNGGDPIALTNKIAALVIKGRKEEAKSLALTAIAAHPNDINIAIQRIQARSPDETPEEVWAQFPPNVQADVGVFIAKLLAKREDNDPTWPEQVKAARLQYPDDQKLKLFEAEAILDTILRADPSSLGKIIEASPSQSEINVACERFRDNWLASQNSEIPKDYSSVHNTALALVMLGRREEAASFLDTAFGDTFDREETKRLRLMLYKGARNEKVYALADSLEDTPMNRVIRGEIYATSQPQKAREILAKRNQFTEKRDVMAATLVVLASYDADKNYQAAAQEVQSLIDKYPDDPHPPLMMYRVLKSGGTGDPAPFLDRAVAALKPDTEFPIRFLVAEALGAAGRHNDVVNVLDGHVGTSHDTPALQSIVASAINSDRRKIATDLLAALPPELLAEAFYRRARISLAFRVGDIATAEQELRAYIADKPRDLELHLRLLQILQNTGRTEELKTECAKPASDFDGSPEHTIQYAVFKDAFGDWKEAHDLAYRTLLLNTSHPDVNFLYVAVFMRPGHSNQLELESPIVSANCAVGILRGTEKEIYIIEPAPDLRPTARHLAPNHPMAVVLLGKAKGEKVQLPGGDEAEILWIKPKQLHVFQDVLDSFPNLFPGMEGLERIQYTPGAPDAFEPIFDRLRTRNDAIENISRSFQEGKTTIAAAAAMTGSEPVETMCGMISAGVTIRSCDGSHPERNLALARIKEHDKKGCLVDAATLHVILRLGVQDAVTGVCGQIGVTERTMTAIQKEIREIEQRQNETDMTLFWRDGQVYRNEISPQMKAERLAQLSADWAWLQANAVVVPATGSEDLRPELKELSDTLGPQVINDYLAAQSSGRLFVSVDQISRVLGETGFQLKTTWLQPVLMLAVNKKLLTMDQYGDAIVNMIGSRFEFISVDTNLTLWSLKDFTGHELPKKFLVITSRLGGPTAELTSHANVAMNAIELFWQLPTTTPFQLNAVTGALLDRLCIGQSIENIYSIIYNFKRVATQGVRRAFHRDYINSWIKGHFFPNPKSADEKDEQGKRKKKRRKK